MYRCSQCAQLWDDNRALDNELTCTRRCGGRLLPVAPLALPALEGCDLGRLPYPVALTADRLAAALQMSGDVLKTLFLLKDCFEATIKYFGAVLLAAYRRSQVRTTERTEILLKGMVRPSLGTWVSDVARPLSLWLIAEQMSPGRLAAALFATPPAKQGSNPAESALLQRCKQFVTYRNDALGHGAQRRDAVYEKDLAEWLPLVRQLLDGVAGMARWRLSLVTAEDRCQAWLGRQPASSTEPGSFSRTEIGHFLLRGPEGENRDLYPFLCYLPDSQQENRLHYYDSLYRYQATKKEATVLEYDNGSRHPRSEPAAGLEEAFTTELLAKAFKWHRGRMEVIEGRVANFGELIEAHAAIVGRQFVIQHIREFLAQHDRGLLVIEAQPGKGKTALMAHLIEEVFDQNVPRPVHFFYRRTAGITNPDVCLGSVYAALLEAHDITEAEESKQKNAPEAVSIKLTNLLSQEIAPRLLPGRPQLIFLDALDEAAGNPFQRIPENLPAGVYIIATTRPVSNRTTLARRQHLHWYDLDASDLLQQNLQDGFAYVQRELVGTELPHETLGEVARVGAGNFLVLKLLCQHVRTRLPQGKIAPFLRRLATEGGRDQLGFIYAEFWERLTEGCTRSDVDLLGGVADVLVAAHAPLTAEVICAALGLRASEWDFALRRLAEYLAVTEGAEGEEGEAFYRIYPESFADFLRAKLAVDRGRWERLLTEYCLGWAGLPEGYGRTYALRFAVAHLLTAGRREEVGLSPEKVETLTGLVCGEFLREKAKVIGEADALADARAVAEALAATGAAHWNELVRCAYAYLALAERVRGDLRALDALVREGPVERVLEIVETEADQARKALLMVAVSVLLSESGHRDLAAPLRSQGAVLVRRTAYSWMQRCLLHVLLGEDEFPLFFTEIEGSPTPTPLADFWSELLDLDGAGRERDRPAAVTPQQIPLTFLLLAYLASPMIGLPFLMILPWACLSCGLAGQWGWLAVGAALWIATVFIYFFGYSALRRRCPRPDQVLAGLTAAYGEAASERRSTILSQALRLQALVTPALADARRRASYGEPIAPLLAEALPNSGDPRVATEWLTLYLRQPVSDAGRQMVADSLRRTDPARYDRLFTEAARVADRRVCGALFELFVTTCKPDSLPDPLLLLLTRFPAQLGDTLSRLRSLSPRLLVNALLASLEPVHPVTTYLVRVRRFLRETTLSLRLPLSSWEPLLWLVLFLPPRLLICLVAFLALVPVAMALPGLALLVLLLGSVAGDELFTFRFRSLAKELSGLTRADTEALSEVLGRVVAWAADSIDIGKNHTPSSEQRLLATTLAYGLVEHGGVGSVARSYPAWTVRRVLQALLRQGIVPHSSALVLVVMGDRQMLEAAVRLRGAGRPRHAPARPDAAAHLGQFRRVLPLPSALFEMLATGTVGCLATVLWATALADWASPPVRHYLHTSGVLELTVLTAILVELRYLMPDSDPELPPARTLLLVVLEIVACFFAPLARFAWLDLPREERTTLLSHGLLFMPALLALVHILVPELIARWRGGYLLYPTCAKLWVHRILWTLAGVCLCALLAAATAAAGGLLEWGLRALR